jgi:putative ABC transport system substrate-binding protein
MIKRREFITILGGTAVAWPLAARAQTTVPAVGYLSAGPPSLPRDLDAFLQGLSQVGYVERHNVAIEFRFAEGQYDRLFSLAAELVSKQVAVIFTTGGVAPALAAKQVAGSIPIVFAHGSDPVKTGLVKSLNRPEANVTGVTFITGILPPKTLELLREVVPGVTVVGVLVNHSATGETRLKEVEGAARALGIRLVAAGAATPAEFDAAFMTLAEERVGAVLVIADPMFRSHHEKIASLAIRYSMPVMSFARDFVVAGVLMSYGTDISDGFREAGLYVGRILKGAKPGDLPVLQPTKFELVINLKTAKALGLEVPPTLLSRAPTR